MVKLLKMSLTNPEFMGALNKLFESQMCFKSHYNVKRLTDALESGRKETAKKFMECVKEYANKDAEGNPAIVEGHWDIPEEKMADFNKASGEIYGGYYEVDRDPLKPEEFSVELNHKEWSILAPIFGLE